MLAVSCAGLLQYELLTCLNCSVSVKTFIDMLVCEVSCIVCSMFTSTSSCRPSSHARAVCYAGRSVWSICGTECSAGPASIITALTVTSCCLWTTQTSFSGTCCIIVGSRRNLVTLYWTHRMDQFNNNLWLWWCWCWWAKGLSEFWTPLSYLCRFDFDWIYFTSWDAGCPCLDMR